MFVGVCVYVAGSLLLPLPFSAPLSRAASDARGPCPLRSCDPTTQQQIEKTTQLSCTAKLATDWTRKERDTPYRNDRHKT